MRAAARTLLLLVAGICCFAADGADTLSRIRAHMRDYLARLPDYTCRVTIERAQRRGSRGDWSVSDRLRLQIAYAGGREYYAWPGDSRFESTIEELLPARGMVSEGSWALHMRKLFLTDDARFSVPRAEGGAWRAGFLVPEALSGFTVSAGGVAVPVALQGAVWFDAETLDVERLEVRVDDTPAEVRIAGTREETVYRREVVGDRPVVLPERSELVLRDRDGSQRRNRSRFDDCHRYAGSATVRYEGAADERAPHAVAAAGREYRHGERVTVRLTAGIPLDVAIGDRFPSGGDTVWISDVRQVGKRWSIEFSLAGTRAAVRRTLALPAAPGTTVTFRVE
ncbi:MAG: hypothetical protein KGN36_11230 [Acidobacteriota bacterium]|nr:hypothetical protein [Acidobacteriota bacterium]